MFIYLGGEREQEGAFVQVVEGETDRDRVKNLKQAPRFHHRAQWSEIMNCEIMTGDQESDT